MNVPLLCKCREPLSTKVHLIRQSYENPTLSHLSTGDLIDQLFPDDALRPCCVAHLLTAVNHQAKLSFFSTSKKIIPGVRR
jgi:hypothetical protein